MELNFKTQNKILVAQICGELDQHYAKSIREAIDQNLGKGFSHLAFDFSRLDFMDSAGIGVIIGRYKNVTATGGKVAVCGANPQVDRILKISGIPKIIPCFDSVDAAVKSL